MWEALEEEWREGAVVDVVYLISEHDTSPDSEPRDDYGAAE